MKMTNSKYLGYSVLIFFVWFLVWSFFPMKLIEKKLMVATGSKEMLDLQPGSSPSDIYLYANKIGEPGRTVLTEMYTFQDLVYPLSYGLFFASALLYFISRSFPNRKKMLWFSVAPILMILADYLENFSILAIISNPDKKLAIAYYVGTFTTIKWVLGFISVVLFLIFGFILTGKKLFRKKNDKIN